MMFDANELPSWLDAELWQDFIEHRKEIGHPMTSTATKRIMMKLYRMKEAGEDIDTALERSIENGWKGIFPVPPELKQSRHASHQDAKHQDLPECDEQTARENIEKLQAEIGKVINISGSGR